MNNKLERKKKKKVNFKIDKPPSPVPLPKDNIGDDHEYTDITSEDEEEDYVQDVRSKMKKFQSHKKSRDKKN